MPGVAYQERKQERGLYDCTGKPNSTSVGLAGVSDSK
jgi:hypothetical protein